MFSPAIFYVNKNQAITLNVSNKSDSKTAVLKFQNNDLSGVGLGVASNEERSITFNAPSFAGEYIYYNAISCNSHYGYEADLEDCWSACVNGSPVFGKMIVTDSLTDLSSQMNVEVPEWECTPTPPSPSSPSPSCQADTWLCDDWGSCSASGSQTRSCSKTFECPSVVTPSPSTSQTCTPPTPEPEPVEYLNTNQAYLSESGIEVTVTNIQKIEEVGSYKYIISYIEKNKTTDKELSPGSFKIFFEAGTGLPQYGFFNNLFPGDSISGSYTFEFLKTKKPFVIEYNNDNEGFFRDIPAPGTLKWSVK